MPCRYEYNTLGWLRRMKRTADKRLLAEAAYGPAGELLTLKRGEATDSGGGNWLSLTTVQYHTLVLLHEFRHVRGAGQEDHRNRVKVNRDIASKCIK